MKDIEGLIAAGTEAVRTVLNRPKNLAKGPCSRNLRELLEKVEGETVELRDEINAENIDYEKTMYESGDAVAYHFVIIDVCRERLGLASPVVAPKTVRDVLTEYLRANGFGGLCGDDCGCGIDEIGWCEHLSLDCKPAYEFKAKCSECQGCESWDEDINPTSCFTTDKEKASRFVPEADYNLEAAGGTLKRPCDRCVISRSDCDHCGPPAWECFKGEQEAAGVQA